MSLTIASYPVAEPITIEEAKNHLNIDLEYSDEDNLIESYIVAARTYCEQYLGYPLVRTAFNWSFNSFESSEIEMPVGRAIAINSITYVDTAQSPNVQTLSTDVYALDSGVNPPVLYLKYGQSWPSVRGGRNDITVNFASGFDDSGASPRDYDDQMPEAIKSAIKLILGELWLIRERTTDIQTYKNDAADNLLMFYRSRSTVCVV
ncbi:MAG: head-tail connector protein [Rickettsiales bacterium]